MVGALLMIGTLLGFIALIVLYDWYAERHNRKSRRHGAA